MMELGYCCWRIGIGWHEGFDQGLCTRRAFSPYPSSWWTVCDWLVAWEVLGYCRVLGACVTEAVRRLLLISGRHLCGICPGPPYV